MTGAKASICGTESLRSEPAFCGGNFDRRSLIAFAGVGLAAATLPNSRARAEDEHAGHDMSKMDHSAAAPHQAIIDAALKCVNRGDVCVAHCIGMLSKGDTSLKDCLRSVSSMLPMCAALAKLAALDAPRLKDLAKLCIDICSDCEKECKKHASHHTACKACAESCAECIDACKKLI